MQHTLEYPPKPGPISLDQITDADRKVLGQLVRGCRNVAEVGTFLGGSSEVILANMEPDGHLLTIDTFCGIEGEVTANVSPLDMLFYALGRLSGSFDRLSVLVGDAGKIAARLKPHSFDAVFLDGAHDYANVKRDIALWLPLVRPGGLLIGHDFDKISHIKMGEKELRERACQDFDRDSGVHCGVVLAVLESLPSVDLSDEKDSSIWWFQPGMI